MKLVFEGACYLERVRIDKITDSASGAQVARIDAKVGHSPLIKVDDSGTRLATVHPIAFGVFLPAKPESIDMQEEYVDELLRAEDEQRLIKITITIEELE